MLNVREVIRPEFRRVRGHIEVYENGKFVVSGDTEAEAREEYDIILEERNQKNA